jgi:hypothetical protein
MMAAANQVVTAARMAQNYYVDISPGNVSVVPACTDLDDLAGCDQGYPVNVRVTVKMNLFLSWFLSEPFTLFRETRMVVQ